MIPVDVVTPLLVVALGALWSEKAGILNIALEGQMLAGAFAAALAWHFTASAPVSVAAALTVGWASGHVLAWGTIDAQADPFIAALGLNLFLPALTGWVSFALFGNLGVIRLEGTPDEGLIAPVAALILTAATGVILYRTPWGLRLRAAGGSTTLVAVWGRSPQSLQRHALAISGALGALGGAVLALRLGAFVPGMSAGTGWIALVALYLGLRRPWPLVLACLALAWAQQASNALQAVPQIPAGLVLALPSLVTTIVYVATSAWRSSASRGTPRSVGRLPKARSHT